MRTQANKQSKLRQCIGAPKRFLKKARDFYVDSMMNIDGMVGYAAVPALSTPVLPTSFIVVRPQKDGDGRGGDNVKDLRKMRHSMSMKEFGCKKVELDKGVGERSYSVVGLGRIATIEEDKSYEFEEEVNVKNDMFARSRSYVIPRRNSGYY